MLLWEGRRKLGGAHRFRGQLMPQLQAEIPHPLGHDLPGFLSRGRVATPTIRLLLLVFVFQRRFKGTAMEVKGHHIGGGESALGQIGQKEFRDDSVANEPNLALLFRAFPGLGGWPQ